MSCRIFKMSAVHRTLGKCVHVSVRFLGIFSGFFFFSLFHGQKSEQTSALLDSTAAATQARGIISPVLDQTGRSSSLHQDGPKNNLGGKPTLFCTLTSFDRMAAALLISPLTLASRCLSAVTRLGHFCRGVWLSALIYLSSPRLLTRLACIHQHPSTTRRSKKQVPVSSLQRFPPPLLLGWHLPRRRASAHSLVSPPSPFYCSGQQDPDEWARPATYTQLRNGLKEGGGG